MQARDLMEAETRSGAFYHALHERGLYVPLFTAYSRMMMGRTGSAPTEEENRADVLADASHIPNVPDRRLTLFVPFHFSKDGAVVEYNVGVVLPKSQKGSDLDFCGIARVLTGVYRAVSSSLDKGLQNQRFMSNKISLTVRIMTL